MHSTGLAAQKRIIMIMGVQRSGTTALFHLMTEDPDLDGYHKDDPQLNDDRYLLRPEPEIRDVLQSARGPVLLKPISETMVRSLEDVCAEYSAHQLDIVWLYRDPVNVVYSWHQKDWIT